VRNATKRDDNGLQEEKACFSEEGHLYRSEEARAAW
jgi:hypothetical protein